NTDILFGSYGDHQGLAFAGGRLYPAWSGNENGGIDATNLLDIRVAQVVTASGPRVLSSTMGPARGQTVHDLNGNAIQFNNQGTPTGAPLVDGFVITFDRAIDPGSIGPQNLRVTYRDVNTSGFSAGTDLTIGTVTPLQEGNTPQGPTRFLVRFAASSRT